MTATPFLSSLPMPDDSSHVFFPQAISPCHASDSSLDMLSYFVPAIETLPEEVLTSILEIACLSSDDDVDRFRNRLSSVSRRWRHIILCTPSFWSVLRLSPSQTRDYLVHSLDIHLERSKQYPLDIRLRCYWRPNITSAVFERIIPHSHRWKRLSIQTPNDEIFSYLKDVPGPSLKAVELYFFSESYSERSQPAFPMTNLAKLSTLSLRNMTLAYGSSLPQLKRLDLRGTIAWPTYFQLCDVLDGSPALENLIMHLKPLYVPEPERYQVQKRAPITLPVLRHCRFITSEGLTSNITDLLQLLSCPKLVSMKVQDIGCAAESETLLQFTKSITDTITNDVTRHSSALSNLYVRSSNPYLAWSSLKPAPTLTTLELRAPQWPAHHQLDELFSNLTTLETLVLREFQASTALEEIGAGPPVSIPQLQTLDIEFRWSGNSEDHHVSQFFRLLSLPRLRCLRLRKIRSGEWENLLYCSHYPSLRSLTLIDMNDFLASTGDPVLAFPFVTEVELVNVRANDFIRRLLQGSRTPYPGWPELRTLTIHGDDLISKPLLHRVVSFRCKIGLQIPKLVLDKHCFNEESRDWLVHHCKVDFN